MKIKLTCLTLLLSVISFAQTLELKKIKKENYSFFDSYTFENIYTLEENLKTTAPFKNFETITNRNLVFIPQNFNRNTAYQDFSKYFLKYELQKVMLEIPGLDRPIDPNPN
ncbi:hypothetical protein Q4512_14365 [Oceanihabitans sp. 2_MG-2023]|nr:hypothetical protein [Oceanihabitans sp. 2_MG-2023]